MQQEQPALEITLAVPAISCQHCASTINGTLGALNGVEQVTTDVPTKTVHLRYRPSEVSVARVIATLDSVGYPVEGQ